jgi:hypothetical protein
MCTFEFEPGMIDYRTVVVTVIVLGCVLVAAVAMEVRPRTHCAPRKHCASKAPSGCRDNGE